MKTRNVQGRKFFGCSLVLFPLVWVLVWGFLLSSTVEAQREWELLFQENFEEQILDRWDLREGWFVTEEMGRGGILSGMSRTWAIPMVEGWADYEIVQDVKITEGTLHINFRYSMQNVSETQWVMFRYYLGLKAGRLYVKKQMDQNFYDLYAMDIEFSPEMWYTIAIQVVGPNIQVYIDEQLQAEVVDTEGRPILSGGFAYETLDDSQVYIDDISVYGPVTPAALGYHWYRTGGPSGGLGYDVRIHPTDSDIMFVTDNPSGVNKSYDGGENWIQRNTDIVTRTGSSMDEIPIFSLTIDPSNPNNIWAGTQNAKGIYRSTDGGESWVKKDDGVTEGNEISFRGFGVHPSNSNIVFAGAEINTGRWGKAFGQVRGKIYKTTDKGENWSSVWFDESLVRFVLFDYLDPQIMYASTGIFDREAWEDQSYKGAGVGILKSTDGGDNWFQINNGIPDSLGYLFTGFLEMHPTNPQILFAASGNNTWGNGGVFRTTNGGQNWSKVLADDIFTIVTFSPSNPNVIYAGSASFVYRSDNGGDTWKKFRKENENNWGPPGVRAGVPIGAVVHPNDPMTIFINNYQGGNFKSVDGGSTWVDASRGYTGAKMIDIEVHPSNPAIVYAIGRSGPFRSFNGGSNWEGMSYSPASYPEWYAVAINPNEPQELLISDEQEGVILKSTNGGGNWKKVFDHPDAGYSCILQPREQMCYDGFKVIAYAPSNPDTVYAGMAASRGIIDGTFPTLRKSYGMYKSTDGGDNWFEINTGLNTAYLNINTIDIHPTNPDIVYIGTWRDGVFKTTDGGGSWVPKNNGLASPLLDVRSLAINPDNPQVIFAGMGDGTGIFKSTDGGNQWNVMNTGLKIECPSYLLPVGRTDLKVSLGPAPDIPLGGEYTSVPWTSIRDIVFDPTDSQTMYAADFHSGFYVSSDGGNTWLMANEGLTMRTINELAISSDGNVIYAATWGEGVFRLVLGENQPPQILLTIPDTRDTLSFVQGDSLLFEVSAYDLNDDVLSYTWFLDGIMIEGALEHILRIGTTELSVGAHSIELEVSDTHQTIWILWNIIITFPTGIQDGVVSQVPRTFALYQNYPNPFNPETEIKFSLPRNSKVTISIYNILGQMINVLIDSDIEAGYHVVNWNGSNVASGIYFCQMKAAEFFETRRMLLLK
ncbi:MAG: T9SS type A sorting domain-containing protein [Gemmatimonadota bacterium]|nr:MAG: T9SS type A sorting domain-containing protein [Gemmatimonadota bacterium]